MDSGEKRIDFIQEYDTTPVQTDDSKLMHIDNTKQTQCV